VSKAKDLCWDIDILSREIQETIKALSKAEATLRKIKDLAEEMARQTG